MIILCSGKKATYEDIEDNKEGEIIMKAYVKPEMEFEIFFINEAISACKEGTYNPVVVSCLVTNHHHLFYSKCESVTCEVTGDPCDGALDYDDIESEIVEYAGSSSLGLEAGEYLVWKSTTSTPPSGGGTIDLNGIADILGTSVEGARGYHAGLITKDIQAGINHS